MTKVKSLAQMRYLNKQLLKKEYNVKHKFYYCRYCKTKVENTMYARKSHNDTQRHQMLSKKL